ncbi:hypothetical protein Lal_00039994 [Lupinus albus]|nr:hypothetical protein Lal_00039994 [Lupinus albus]
MGKKNSKESKKNKNLIYVQWITTTKKKYFVLVRPIILYEIADGINLVKPFPQDLFQERDNLELKVLNYILYGNGKSIREISDTSIQLVRTCLVLTGIKTKKYEWFDWRFYKNYLGKSHTWDIRKRNDPYGSGLIPENQSDRTNINTFDSIYSKEKIQQSLSQNHGTIRMLLNRNNQNKLRSLIILSSANCFKMVPFNDVIQQIKRSLLIPIKNSLGPLGITVQVANLYSFYCLITHNQISITPNLQLTN